MFCGDNMNFHEFEELIASGVKEITLTEDVILEDGEEENYKAGIEISIDRLAIDGNSHVIDAKGKTRFFINQSHNLILKNIKFINGRSKKGGAILNIIDSNLEITNCVFDNNSSDGDFEAGLAGVIHNKSAFLNVTNCIFKNNSSRRSGGVIFDEAGHIEIKGCEFSLNKTERFGGVICTQRGFFDIKDSRFIDNEADMGGQSLFNEGGVLNIESCEFKGKDEDIILNCNMMSIKDILIEKHQKIITSDLIEVVDENNDYSSNILLTNFSIWELNDLIHCGDKEIILENDFNFIYLNSNEYYYNRKAIEIDVDNLIIDGQGHSIDGANQYGIFKITGKNIILRNINFINAQGGFIENHGDSLTIEDCSFINSKLSEYHYDIFDYNCLGGWSKGSLFCGGAIFNKNGKINIINSVFKSNIVDDSGGAIFNKKGLIDIKNSIFEDNSSKLSANDIYNDKGKIILTDCEFKGEYSDIIFNKEDLSIDKCDFKVFHEIYNEGHVKNNSVVQIKDIKRFDYLNSLLNSNNHEINLDYDILEYKNDDSKDSASLTLERDMVIDGNGHAISAKNFDFVFEIHSKSVTLKNMIFENVLFKSPNHESQFTLENCIFKGNSDKIIENNSILTIKDCQFEKHHKILNRRNIDNLNVSEDIIINQKGANDFLDLINNGKKEIVLECDYYFDDDLTIDVDDLVIDGNNHTFESVNCEFEILGDNITFKNINFKDIENLSKIKNKGYLNIENCNLDSYHIFASDSKLNLFNSYINCKSILMNHVRHPIEGIFSENSILCLDNCNVTGISCIDSELEINNCIIENVPDLYYSGISSNKSLLKLNKCDFNDLRYKVIIQESSVEFKDCNFEDSKYIDISYSSVNFCGCNFTNNKSPGNGGAINASDSSVKVVNSIFDGNSSKKAGKVIYSQDSTLMLDACEFREELNDIVVNRHSHDDVEGNESIIIKNTKFKGHHQIITTENILLEGNIGLLGENIKIIEDSKFLSDLISSNQKEINLDNYFFINGFISINEDNLVIDGCGNTIDGNRSEYSGFIINGENITLKNIHFKNINTEYDTGSVVFNKSRSLKIENCSFENISGFGDNGRAIYNDKGHINIENSLFKTNVAASGLDKGGAIYNHLGSIDITNSDFIDNHTGHNGGAIYNFKGNINIFQCNFKGNCKKYLGETYTISYGGAIHNDHGQIDICQSSFKDNFVYGYGDAIFNEGRMNLKSCNFDGRDSDIISNKGILSLEDCKFDNDNVILNNSMLCILENQKNYLNNFISNNFGKIHYISDVEAIPNKNNFKYLDELINLQDNSEIALSCDIVVGNDEHDYFDNGIEIKRDNIVIDGNGHTIDGNLKSSIFKIESKNITLKNIVFKNALSTLTGAINASDAKITLENCIFKSTVSLSSSGVFEKSGSIFLENSHLELINSKFDDGIGSALISHNSSINIVSCEFESIEGIKDNIIYIKNSAIKINKSSFLKNHGNNILMHFDDSSLDISDSVFEKNLMGIAAIYDTKSSGNNHFKNCIFNGNVCEEPLCTLSSVNSRKFSFDGCNFINNSVSRGGLIYFNYVSLFISRCCFENNKSLKWFPNKLIDGNNHIYLKNCIFKNNQHYVALIKANRLNISDEEYNSLKKDLDVKYVSSIVSLDLSDKNNIILESDIFLEDSLEINNNLLIEGNNKKIYCDFKEIHTNSNVIFKNIVFEDVKISNTEDLTLENCFFEGFVSLVNAGEITLKNCEFENDYLINNEGTVILIEDDKKDVLRDKKIELYKTVKDDDEKEPRLGLGALFW